MGRSGLQTGCDSSAPPVHLVCCQHGQPRAKGHVRRWSITPCCLCVLTDTMLLSQPFLPAFLCPRRWCSGLPVQGPCAWDCSWVFPYWELCVLSMETSLCKKHCRTSLWDRKAVTWLVAHAGHVTCRHSKTHWGAFVYTVSHILLFCPSPREGDAST